MPFLANNSYFTPTPGNATMSGCGNISQLQSRGVEIGSASLGLPSDEQWLEWARETLSW